MHENASIPLSVGVLGGFCTAPYIANLFVNCNDIFLSRGDGTPYDILFALVNGHPVFYPLMVAGCLCYTLPPIPSFFTGAGIGL